MVLSMTPGTKQRLINVYQTVMKILAYALEFGYIPLIIYLGIRKGQTLPGAPPVTLLGTFLPV